MMKGCHLIIYLGSLLKIGLGSLNTTYLMYDVLCSYYVKSGRADRFSDCARGYFVILVEAM
jgi:hypothetical protein